MKLLYGRAPRPYSLYYSVPDLQSGGPGVASHQDLPLARKYGAGEARPVYKKNITEVYGSITVVWRAITNLTRIAGRPRNLSTNQIRYRWQHRGQCTIVWALG